MGTSPIQPITINTMLNLLMERYFKAKYRAEFCLPGLTKWFKGLFARCDCECDLFHTANGPYDI